MNQPYRASDGITAAQKLKNRRDNLKGHKHCEGCTKCLPPEMYRKDPNGLFGRAAVCLLCETRQAIESGEIKPVCPDIWRQQKPKIQAPPEHPRHQSGFPCNPFTGKRTKPHAGAHSATHHVETPAETEEAF